MSDEATPDEVRQMVRKAFGIEARQVVMEVGPRVYLVPLGLQGSVVCATTNGVWQLGRETFGRRMLESWSDDPDGPGVESTVAFLQHLEYQDVRFTHQRFDADGVIHKHFDTGEGSVVVHTRKVGDDTEGVIEGPMTGPVTRYRWLADRSTIQLEPDGGNALPAWAAAE